MAPLSDSYWDVRKQPTCRPWTLRAGGLFAFYTLATNRHHASTDPLMALSPLLHAASLYIACVSAFLFMCRPRTLVGCLLADIAAVPAGRPACVWGSFIRRFARFPRVACVSETTYRRSCALWCCSSLPACGLPADSLASRSRRVHPVRDVPLRLSCRGRQECDGGAHPTWLSGAGHRRVVPPAVNHRRRDRCVEACCAANVRSACVVLF